ncbi:hypothetical protein HYX04_03140 [Candidatus Woesearchaeota archaeon]|nr:hypothetical protein [Candidatus Woesearchaeota archaeon]
MRKTKQFWGKLKYWQKGGVIGLIFGLIVFYFSFSPFYDSPFLIILIALPYLSFATILWILNALPNDPLAPEGIVVIAVYLSPIFYTLLGILIGLIIGKIKKKWLR